MLAQATATKEEIASNNVASPSAPESPKEQNSTKHAQDDNLTSSAESLKETATESTLEKKKVEQSSVPVSQPAPVSVPTSLPVQPSQESTQEPANVQPKQESPSPQLSPQKAIVTKVKLSDELNLFDWFRSADIISQLAEKAKSSVDSVITVLDPGMKEYLCSGGNINVIVISDSERLVSPIRDAFQTVFGKATVVAARYNPPEAATDYPVKLACGFEEAITVAQERIKRLRNDTSTVPQNQVVVIVQPTLVSVVKDAAGECSSPGLDVDENLIPKWFLTYSMVIEDPVLSLTLNSYSQFVPIDSDIVATAKEAKFPDSFSETHLGFARSIDDLMNSKLALKPNEFEDPDNGWINTWSGLDEIKIVHDLSTTLAHLYKRKRPPPCIG